jgi:hypothetical protein
MKRKKKQTVWIVSLESYDAIQLAGRVDGIFTSEKKAIEWLSSLEPYDRRVISVDE